LPGTTRDTIEETADFDGIPVLLTDTAGLRPVDKADAVEQLGIARTSAKLAEAEVCLLVFDASAPFDEDDKVVLGANDGRPEVIVFNKIDLPRATDSEQIAALRRDHRIVEISAKTREGLDQLRNAVVHAIEADVSRSAAAPLIANLRHLDALTKAGESLRLARQSIDDGRPPDVIAVDVQDAIDHVGSITGVVTTEEVLDRIFSQFCIGK
jgi:tRNA modification GTPase